MTLKGNTLHRSDVQYFFNIHKVQCVCNNRRRSFRLASHYPGAVLHSAHCSVFGFRNHTERLSIQCQHMKLPHISCLMCAGHHHTLVLPFQGSCKNLFLPWRTCLFLITLDLILQGTCASVNNRCGMA